MPLRWLSWGGRAICGQSLAVTAVGSPIPWPLTAAGLLQIVTKSPEEVERCGTAYLLAVLSLRVAESDRGPAYA